MTYIVTAFEAQELVRRYERAEPERIKFHLSSIYESITARASQGYESFVTTPLAYAYEIKEDLIKRGYRVENLAGSVNTLHISWEHNK